MLDRLRKCVWQIAIRKRDDNLLFENDGISKPFILIKNTIRYWCADPFLIDYRDKKYLFFELYDRLKRKGAIGYREIKNEKISKIYKAYETTAHLSYPFIFEKDGNLFIIPESNNLNKLILLQLKPNSKRLRFECKGVLLDNIALADATFTQINNEYIMFATPVTDGDNSSKLNLYRLKDSKWVLYGENPVINNKANARMAGKIINRNDKMIRCSQNCSVTYGGGVNFSYVDCEAGQFNESLFLSLGADDIKLNSKIHYDGIHTYNYDDMFEVIDVKRNSVFNFVECIGYMLEKLHITKKQGRHD